MKWITVRPGNYKLVEDDDPRPEVKLPSRPGAPSTHFSPSWKKYEAGVFLGNAKQQEEYSDKFMAERAHAIKTDPQARRWEESRRKSVAKDKAAWRKERMKSDPILAKDA